MTQIVHLDKQLFSLSVSKLPKCMLQETLLSLLSHHCAEQTLDLDSSLWMKTPEKKLCQRDCMIEMTVLYKGWNSVGPEGNDLILD